MPSHYSDMGFEVGSIDDIKAICDKNINNVRIIKCGKADYHFFCIDKYIEFWIQINKKKQVLGLEFHYIGKSFTNLKIIKWLSVNKNKQAGLLRCELDGMPINLNIPNVAILPKLKNICTFQIACFANEASFFKNEEEYMSSKKDELKYAANHFIPSGTFSFDKNKKNEQDSHAIFAGEIIDFEKRLNTYSNKEYYYFSVATFNMTLDVLVDKEIVPDNVSIGNIISGSFWLSAKFIGNKIDEVFSLAGFERKLELIDGMLIETGGSELIMSQIIFFDSEFAKLYTGNKNDLINIIDKKHSEINTPDNAEWKYLKKHLFILESIKKNIMNFQERK